MNVIRWGAGVAVALTAAAVVAAPSALALPIVSAAADGVEVIGLSERGSQIVSFNTANPSDIRMVGAFKGISTDRMIGIDYRSSDHLLYGVGKSGKIYKIDPGTAQVTKVGQLSIAIEGGYWDIDFNSSGSALRIVTDSRQNLRQAFGTSGPTGSTVKEGTVGRSNIAGLGYTDANMALGIDAKNRQIVVLDGASGKVTNLGPTNVFPTISTLSNGIDFLGSDGFATVNLNHYHTLFQVNMSNGTAQMVGQFNPTGNGAESFRHVIDLTIKR